MIQCNYQLQLAMQAFAEGGAPAMVREMNAQYATSTDVLSRPYAFVHNVTNATCAVMLAHPDKVLVSGNCDPFLVGPSFKLLNENGIPYIRLSAALTQHVS